jgi:hypothetical protein
MCDKLEKQKQKYQSNAIKWLSNSSQAKQELNIQ